MAKGPTITTIASGYYSRTALNDNFTNIDTAFDNTLSLDGSTPNSLGADIDLNNNDILNVNDLSATRITLNGSLMSPSSVVVDADSVNFTPTGTIASTDVQAALAEIDTDLSALYPSTGSSLVGYTQGGTGSVANTVQSKLRESVSVKDFGAVGDGTTDDTAAIQAAIDSLTGVGGSVYLPQGVYRTTSVLTMDYSANSTDPSESFLASGGPVYIQLYGDGAAASRISSNHSGVCLNIIGGTSAGVHTFVNVSKLGLGCQPAIQTVGSVGLQLHSLAYATFSELDLAYFEYGMKGTDVLTSEFNSVRFRLNEYGSYMIKGTSTHPNNISFNDCSYINNQTYGAYFIKPHLVRFKGGSVESNGYTGTLADTNSWGVRGDNSNAEAAIGMTFDGVYFENNNGRADVYILQDIGYYAGFAFHGCSFMRIDNTRYVTNNIAATMNSALNVVSVTGCGFKSMNTYVDSGARSFIASAVYQISDNGGNLFLDNALGTTGIGTDIYKPPAHVNGVYLGGRAATNLLETYEQSTFTPVMDIGGSTTGIVYGGGAQKGVYTLIGKRVFYEIFITLTSKGGLTGEMSLTGLPYPVADTFGLGATSVESSSTISYFTGLATSVSSLGAAARDTDKLTLYYVPAAGATIVSALGGANITDAFSVRVSGSYLTD